MPEGFVAADYDDVEALGGPGCYGWVCDADAADGRPVFFPGRGGELRIVSGDPFYGGVLQLGDSA